MEKTMFIYHYFILLHKLYLFLIHTYCLNENSKQTIFFSDFLLYVPNSKTKMFSLPIIVKQWLEHV